MKALAKLERAPGLTMTDVKKPEVGHNDVMIKIKKTAICGTDIHIWKWDDWAQKTIPVPMHVGHEYEGSRSGRVADERQVGRDGEQCPWPLR